MGNMESLSSMIKEIEVNVEEVQYVCFVTDIDKL
jgi:hypothetical protein